MPSGQNHVAYQSYLHELLYFCTFAISVCIVRLFTPQTIMKVSHHGLGHNQAECQKPRSYFDREE